MDDHRQSSEETDEISTPGRDLRGRGGESRNGREDGPQNREEMEVLFALLADRYERGSVMLTSNLPFSQWEQIFKDPMTTAAAINRLVHHSIILELNLPSYRLEQSQSNQEKIQESGE